MKSGLLALFVLLISAGCTSINSDKDVLYMRYMEYGKEANAKNIKGVAADYFSTPFLKELDLDDDRDKAVLLMLKYKNIYSHHEKLNGKNGCLSLNGFDSNKSPIVLSLYYKDEAGDWLIGGFHVVYVNSASKFVSQAECSRDALMKLLDD